MGWGFEGAKFTIGVHISTQSSVVNSNAGLSHRRYT
jgi:hypothetical protein